MRCCHCKATESLMLRHVCRMRSQCLNCLRGPARNTKNALHSQCGATCLMRTLQLASLLLAQQGTTLQIGALSMHANQLLRMICATDTWTNPPPPPLSPPAPWRLWPPGVTGRTCGQVLRQLRTWRLSYLAHHYAAPAFVLRCTLHFGPSLMTLERLASTPASVTCHLCQSPTTATGASLTHP
jgi:hypothetical protein